MRIAYLFFLLLSIPSFLLADDTPDYIIEPGVRVGPITAHSTEEELIKIFGSSNVITSDLQAGEVVYKGTILFPNDPDKKLTISWKDRNPNRNPDSISIWGDKWATKEGVTLGMPLEDIVRLNGNIIELSNEGDSWDFWGIDIHDVKNGVLKDLVGKGLFVGLGPTEVQYNKVSPDFWDERSKDGTILSDHPGIKKLHYRVQGMHVIFGLGK